MKIEIVKLPQGEAPESIKREWVGLQMDAVQVPRAAGVQGVVSGKPVAYAAGAYAVRFSDAMEALLAAGKEEAASFWRGLGFDPEDRLIFHLDECREFAPA